MTRSCYPLKEMIIDFILTLFPYKCSSCCNLRFCSDYLGYRGLWICDDYKPEVKEIK